MANLLRLRVALHLKDTMGIAASISGGLSEFQPADTSAEDVLTRADYGLYESKRNEPIGRCVARLTDGSRLRDLR